MNPSNLIPLIELTRGGHPECLHFGAIAVVDKDGKLIASAGNPHHVTFTRSTLKALQALPFVESGGAQQLGFAPQHLAMMCASHSGEEKHVIAVQEMLDKAGMPVARLQCGCHVPYYFELTGTAPAAQQRFDARHNNCSGKHAGFLGWCAVHEVAPEDYLAVDSPLQKAIRTHLARAVRMDEQDFWAGTDGCSAPNYGMPLSRLALGYARLAQGAQDPEFGSSFAALSEAMTQHPDLVSGQGRNDEAFMRIGAGDWVSKVGADGVQVIGSKSRREAIAIKIIDGNKPALYAASVEALDQLGWLDAGQRAALQPWRAPTIVNVRGLNVGARQAVFKLVKG